MAWVLAARKGTACQTNIKLRLREAR